MLWQSSHKDHGWARYRFCSYHVSKLITFRLKKKPILGQRFFFWPTFLLLAHCRANRSIFSTTTLFSPPSAPTTTSLIVKCIQYGKMFERKYTISAGELFSPRRAGHLLSDQLLTTHSSSAPLAFAPILKLKFKGKAQKESRWVSVCVSQTFQLPEYMYNWHCVLSFIWLNEPIRPWMSVQCRDLIICNVI